MLGRLCLKHFGVIRGSFFLPLLWTGLEYFRSELYPLKFSWLNVGYAFSYSGWQPILHFTGIYGIGFLVMAVAAGLSILKPKTALATAATALVLGLLPSVVRSAIGPARELSLPGMQVAVAGVQLEFPAEFEVIAALDKLIAQHPEAELLFLSEYAFLDGPVPERVRYWCRDHQRYLLAGAKDPAPAQELYDTAFVVGPTGEVLFHQAKCVPVQFMKDGLPAKDQSLWDSPWGKIGICICYDLSYTRVTDRLVKLASRTRARQRVCNPCLPSGQLRHLTICEPFRPDHRVSWFSGERRTNIWDLETCRRGRIAPRSVVGAIRSGRDRLFDHRPCFA
jgi:hypothetical protein